MAPHSSTLAWKIPWTEEPGGLQSIGSQRVGHDWVTSFTHLLLDEASCTGCCWWLGDARTCIQVVCLVWVLSIRYSLGLVLWSLGPGSQYSHSKGSGLDLWSGTKIPQVVMASSEIKTNIQKQETKDEPQTNCSYKIRQIIMKIMEYTHTHTHIYIYIHTPMKVQ